MRSMIILLFLLLFSCLLERPYGQPMRLHQNDDSEMYNTEYENDEANSNDSLRDEEEARLNKQEPRIIAQQEDLPRFRRLPNSEGNQYMQHVIPDERKTNIFDNFSEYKSRNSDIHEEKIDKPKNLNNEFQPFSNRQFNKYTENSNVNMQPDPEPAQHLTDRNLKSYKSNHIQDNQQNKRTAISHVTSDEKGDMLFEDNREQINKLDKYEYNDNPGNSEELSHFYKQYSNTIQTENRKGLDRNFRDARFILNRDRRQAQQTTKDTLNLSSTASEKEELENVTNEDEETAIKRHIKKLSGEELKELLNSLSEDKRALLKKIIDSDADDNHDNINKREITKKAGAVEENILIESGQSDSNKIQGGNSFSLDMNINTESCLSQASETLEGSKHTESQTENNEISTTKKTENTEIKTELTSQTHEIIEEKTNNNLNSLSLNSDSKNQAIADAQMSKNENKRETVLDDLSNMDTSFDDIKQLENDFNLKDSQEPVNEQSYICSQDGLSQFSDEESQVLNTKSDTYKREALLENDVDLADSIKSLEDSFPNSNTYDESGSYSGSDMAPLVRVKRKNTDLVVKKRAAALLPDAKVAYFPYNAENDDVDNDEGNEFDDDGFYDRTSNFARSDLSLNNKQIEELSANNFNLPSQRSKMVNKYIQSIGKDNPSKLSRNNNIETDTMSLGSDTDDVLSSVEGIDDNLMYNSGSRNRRIAEENSKLEVSSPDLKIGSTPLIDEELKSASGIMNAPNYQENDAFGSLPRNYEGELGRYKRIRRVKPSLTSGEINTVNT